MIQILINCGIALLVVATFCISAVAVVGTFIGIHGALNKKE